MLKDLFVSEVRLKILKTISLRCNCAVLLIHHQKKGGQDFGREADKLRGSNSIEAEATTILQLSQDTKHKAVRINQTKNKLGEPIKNIYFTINQNEAGDKIVVASASIEFEPRN